MNQLFSRPLTYIALLAFIVLGGWISFLPSQISAHFKLALQEQFGRTATVGKSNYSFNPEFGIALQNVTIAGSAEMPEAVFHAESVVLPLSLWQILTAQAAPQKLVVDGADIRVVFDGVGHSNVFSGASPKSFTALQIQFLNSSFHYFDERHGDQFQIDQVSGIADYSLGGEIKTSGRAVANGQFINFVAELAALERVFSDGSPLDLNVEGVASSLSFSGRLATSKQLNLAGQVEVITTDSKRFVTWLGMPLNGLKGGQKFSLSGAFDSEGPTVFLKDAALKLGESNAKGEISFSAAGERPNLTAALQLDNLDFSFLRNTSSGWSDTAIDFSDLNSFDFQFRLAAPSLVYGAAKMGATTFEGTLKDRVLDAALNSQDSGGGTGQIDFKLDATQLPPRLNIDAAMANVAAEPVFNTFLGAGFGTGNFNLSTHVSATGKSQTEIISTLHGEAEFEMSGGRLLGVDLSKLEASNAVGWNGGETGDFKGKAKFTLEDGVATFGENNIAGAGVSLRGEGEIDILRQSLDVVIGPSPKVKIQGPWSKPKFLPQ